VRYKIGSSRGKERIRKVTRGRNRWRLAITVVIGVNVRLPLIGNVIGERIIIGEMIERG